MNLQSTLDRLLISFCYFQFLNIAFGQIRMLKYYPVRVPFLLSFRECYCTRLLRYEGEDIKAFGTSILGLDNSWLYTFSYFAGICFSYSFISSSATWDPFMLKLNYFPVERLQTWNFIFRALLWKCIHNAIDNYSAANFALSLNKLITLQICCLEKSAHLYILEEGGRKVQCLGWNWIPLFEEP
jgi:hypothetical protein